jgi:glycosyltransferase involved in cell wall biosynthesis
VFDQGALIPGGSGVADEFSADVLGRKTEYRGKFSGLVDVPADGDYVFTLMATDGGSLTIDIKVIATTPVAFQQVCGVDGVAVRPTTGSIALAKGLHRIEVVDVHGEGSDGFRVLWQGPGAVEQVIPPSALIHPTTTPWVSDEACQTAGPCSLLRIDGVLGRHFVLVLLFRGRDLVLVTLGNSLPQFLADFAKRLVFSQPPGVFHPDFDDDRLNLLYNACDIGINTSDREGWGLVSFEHAATGAPQIVSDLPALRELWHNSAILLPTESAPSNQVPGRISPTVNPWDLAQALEQLYHDQAARERYGRCALLNARSENYRWDNIAIQWIQLIKETLCR